MEIAILLHLYQPVTQSEEVFRRVYKESYEPLIRRVGRTKNFKVSLDIPLSLLEQMDRYGYSDWISDVRDMVRVGKVELVGSAAYHPILAKLSEKLVQQEVILNEYGLGYYLGDHQNLEGDPAIMVQNIVGFFPPELAVNEDVLATLDDLGYKWMIVDETAIPEEDIVGGSRVKYGKHGVYRYKDYGVKMIARNRAFSNVLSFKRDLDMGEITQLIDEYQSREESFVIVLDGEFFGHHFDQGFLLLNRIISYVRKKGIDIVTVSDHIEGVSTVSIRRLQTSSWGATDEDMASGVPFPMWDAPTNEIHQLQWEIVNELSALYTTDNAFSEMDEYAVLPVWDPEGLKRIDNPVLRGKIAREVLMQKCLNSDQFWWASKESLPTGEVLYDPGMVKKGLTVFEHLLGMYNNGVVAERVMGKIERIRTLLEG
ncbi:hypothetical protein GF360_00035 [candidate division WWE3 bacterium]|nr:hypothetical protein [candidate division WWE3 bacterium]